MTAELSSINPNTSLRGVVVSPTDCVHCGKELCNDLGWCNSYKPAGLPVKSIKAPVDLLCEIDQLVDAAIREGRMRQRDPDHYDYGDDPTDKIWPRVTEEVERLQGCEYDLGEILEATTGVLLVLSRLQKTIAAMGPEEARAVARFADAVKEATNG